MTSTRKEDKHSELLPGPLVETDWLEQHLGEPDLRVFDCTVETSANPDQELARKFPLVFESARAQFSEAHIPGAGFIDIPGKLSNKSSQYPLMMPSEAQFTDAMSKYGIGADTRVVLYSTAEANWAARVWWMLRAFGFNNAAILNGGLAKWSSEKRPVSSQPCKYFPSRFITQPRPDAFVDKNDVLAAIDNDDVRIICALPAPMYEGTGGPVFNRKGHIAGSVNIPFGSLHDPNTGNYLAVDQLQKRFDKVDANKARQIIAYCGAGIGASNTAFALSLLGYDKVAVYDASMFEWGNDHSLPMEAG